VRNYLNSIHEAFQNTLDYFTQHGRGIEWATVALKFHLAYILIQPKDDDKALFLLMPMRI